MNTANRMIQKIMWVLVLVVAVQTVATAQQDPRDAFYSPPASSKFLKAASGNSSSNSYSGDYIWALRFYPARLWYTTNYFGFERSLTKSFSVSLDAGWHSSRAGMFINSLGPGSVFDGEFDGPAVSSTQSYGRLLVNGTTLTNNIPSLGFSGRIFTREKEGHKVPFIQFQYQFSQTKLKMQDYDDVRFAGANDTALLQLHTVMVRFGRQWTYGQKIKILNELSIGFGVNMRVSSAYEDVVVTSGTPGTTNYNFYYLNSLTGEMQRAITPRFQIAYSIGIAY